MLVPDAVKATPPAACAPREETPAVRLEHDLLGELPVPQEAYYGIHTLRALRNFPVSGVSIGRYPDLVRALSHVKEAAAITNGELGLLDAGKVAAITWACQQIRTGAYDDQFVVDVMQGGGGTSTNMNANEVVANIALEHLGHPRGDYGTLHPLEHVNLSQSTNDVYPTSISVALATGLLRLLEAMDALRQAFAAKAVDFADVLKMGRTCLQDAVPMTLGQEFGTYAVMLRDGRARLEEAARLLHEVNLGGTAIGTGLNAPAGYAQRAVRHLAELTGVGVTLAPDLVTATQDVGAFVQLSGVLRGIAVKLSKTCNDLRLLSSGPRAGLGEIDLPPVQAGSSIMPGKVNPVIPEAVNQIAYAVIGHDLTVTMAAEAGQLQGNAFEPVIAYSLFQSVEQLRAACVLLASRCVTGITANIDALRRSVYGSVGAVTALVPHIGYVRASELAREALESGGNVIDLVLAKGLLGQQQLDGLLGDLDRLARPHAVTVQE